VGSFQVGDALGILFEFEKPPVEHLEGFILCREKVASCRIFSELLTGNSSSRIRKNAPTGSVKASTPVVGGMFVVAAMSC
jgi:hypothetical protein